MADLNNPILKEFLLESQENLSSISEELTKYESGNDSDPELIHSIYRKVHTLKGSASFLAFSKLENLTHSVETVLDHFREGGLSPAGEMIDLLLESFDCCQDVIRKIEETGEEGEVDYTELAGRIISLLEHQLINENANADETVGDYPGEMPEGTIEDPGEKEHDAVQEEVPQETAPTPVKMESAPEKTPDNTEAINKKISEKKQQTPPAPTGKSVADSTVRVNVQLLDKILNVVGELVLNRNQILQLSKENEEPELNRLSHQLNVITTELQTDIMTTRMQPVGAVFNKFERIVRDISRSQEKEIRLEIQGQETELDKTLLEVIKDPLTHLIRNAIDHGVEKPDERVAKGKPKAGSLAIKAYHAGGQVIIEISDDGNGINVPKVLEKAVSKGIMTQEEAEKCPHQKALNLIFHPGFSTSTQVTNISGRGVGMDVVKSNIERIGGKCDISSIEGKGTTFKLNIPLTLAIVPGLVVKGGGETFAIPQKNLVELVLLEDNEFEDIEKLYDSEFYRLRGELIPIFRMNETLSLTKEYEPEHHINIIVLNSEMGTYGLIVDDILDTQEIVVKPLSRKLKTGDVYAGATIMGDGSVALILDALGYFNMVDKGKGEAEHTQEDYQENLEAKRGAMESEEILLFELEDNRHYGIPLCLISRLEEFNQEKVEMSGKQSLIKYRGAAMPLISLNNEVSYGQKKKAKLKEVTENSHVLPCIVSQVKGQSVGFTVENIIDIARTESNINQESVESNGVMGTTYVNDHLITILDIHEIVEKLKILKRKTMDENYKGRVLIVEDSTLYQRVLQESLESQNYEVFIADNGRKGLEALKKGDVKYDLVITDIEMPEMDGFELVRNIRESDGAFKDIPIVAVTTRVAEDDLKKGQDVGISRHLEKLNKEEVLESVQELLAAQ